MNVACSHCGHRHDVPAQQVWAKCQKCNREFEAISDEERAAQRRGRAILAGVIALLLVLLLWLLLSPNGSRGAREAIFGKAGLGKFAGGGGEGSGTANGNGFAEGKLGNNGIPDPQATNLERSPDISIGRMADVMGERKAGDDVRAGAAGRDQPMATVGNSRDGQGSTNAAAGANPPNSTRNSVETPAGAQMQIGAGGGGQSPTVSTNTRNSALLLDDFSERLRQAGARSGDVQISLEWKNINDLDLHVIDPTGEEIFYNNRGSASGGLLDVDMNASRVTWRPVENVYWPERGAPRGTYRVEVVHFANHGAPDPTQFTVRVVNKGNATYYRGFLTYVAHSNRARTQVCTFIVQ